jgi:hypothetical protein
MSEFYTFIATKTTNDRVIPTANIAQSDFNRQIALAFADITGGTIRVGELKLMPKPDAIPNFLLCNGTEVAQDGFPELYAYLGDSEGPASSGNFRLPNYIGAFTPAATAPVQTVEGGTVSTGGAVTTPTQPGETGSSVGGNIPSGGRYVLRGDEFVI